MADSAESSPDVVIIYERKHKDMAKRITASLEESGIKVWFDDTNELSVAMSHIIQSSRVVLVCTSQSSPQLKYAQDCGKCLILLQLDCYEGLATGNIDFKFYQGIGQRDFFLTITKLANAVQAILNEGV